MGTEAIVPILARSFYVHAPEVPDGFKPHNADDDLIRQLLGRKSRAPARERSVRAGLPGDVIFLRFGRAGAPEARCWG